MTKYLSKTVTKTQRVIEMIRLYDEIEPLKTELSKTDPLEIFEPYFDSSQEAIKNKISVLETRLNHL
jgi:hypothetical protein